MRVKDDIKNYKMKNDVSIFVVKQPGMNSMKLVNPLYFISLKKTPNDDVTPQRQSQFTPKMKANAELRLLSSLV